MQGMAVFSLLFVAAVAFIPWVETVLAFIIHNRMYFGITLLIGSLLWLRGKYWVVGEEVYLLTNKERYLILLFYIVAGLLMYSYPLFALPRLYSADYEALFYSYQYLIVAGVCEGSLLCVIGLGFIRGGDTIPLNKPADGGTTYYINKRL